ncbi:MAG: hypothetical protein D6812_03675 [Deltaproteobacteria bacterium]|nr:MAG: hypothetical protein D6812_03675 [Deltaproteobacteria bacterium]
MNVVLSPPFEGTTEGIEPSQDLLLTWAIDHQKIRAEDTRESDTSRGLATDGRSASVLGSDLGASPAGNDDFSPLASHRTSFTDPPAPKRDGACKMKQRMLYSLPNTIPHPI